MGCFFKGHELRYQHGKGPFNIFILDTSSFLGEKGSIQLKDTFAAIIDGNKPNKMVCSLTYFYKSFKDHLLNSCKISLATCVL